jgi:hypothetical protein
MPTNFYKRCLSELRTEAASIVSGPDQYRWEESAKQVRGWINAYLKNQRGELRRYYRDEKRPNAPRDFIGGMISRVLIDIDAQTELRDEITSALRFVRA